MLSVFKKYQGWLVICECLIALLTTALIADKKAWYIAAAVFFGLSLLAFLVMEVMAGVMHRRLLGILYTWQKPDSFIAAYAPLIEQKGVRKNVLFTMKAYLSNGYAAKGSFSKALAILEDMPELSGKNGVSAQALAHGNRCSILLDAGELERAEKEYEQFLQRKDSAVGTLRQELEATDEQLSLKLALARGNCGEEEERRARLIYLKGGSALNKTQMSLLMGQMYLQLSKPELARDCLNDAAKAEKSLWASKKAAALLKKQ